MSKTVATLAIAFLAATSASAMATESCQDGYKHFMSKMSIYYDQTTGEDLADAVRKSLDAYASCKAGDGFSPHGVWDQILADEEAKAKKK